MVHVELPHRHHQVMWPVVSVLNHKTHRAERSLLRERDHSLDSLERSIFARHSNFDAIVGRALGASSVKRYPRLIPGLFSDSPELHLHHHH
jgi:hypothetical protein